MIHLYDAQTHRITKYDEVHASDFQNNGFTAREIQVLPLIVLALSHGADELPLEAKSQFESRVWEHKRDLVRRGVIHDIRINWCDLSPLTPTFAGRRSVFVKFMLRFDEGMHNYKFMLSDTEFDLPEIGALDKL